MKFACYPRCQSHAALQVAAQAVVAHVAGVPIRAWVFEVVTSHDEKSSWAGVAAPIKAVPGALMEVTAAMAHLVDEYAADDTSTEELLDLMDIDDFFSVSEIEGMTILQSMHRLIDVRQALEILISHWDVWHALRDHLIQHGVLTEIQLPLYFDQCGSVVPTAVVACSIEAST